jgi:hypothetical protein
VAEPAQEAEPHNFDQLLDRLEAPVEHHGEVTVRELHEAIGERSFGPLLVAVGIAGVTPLAAVPSVPTLLALCAALVAVQLMIGRKSFWLPRFILDRHVTRGRVRSSVRLARRPARFVDRLIKPRLHLFTGAAASRIVAIVVVALAFLVPPLELVPLAAGLPSLAILAFGLGLIARDGVLVLIATAVSGGALFLAAQKLLG